MTKFKIVDRKEFLIFCAFFLLFGSIALYINVPNISQLNYHFGGEYGNIAASVVNGEGYANPFGTNSGPTSWMPPFYTYLLVFIFSLFGIKTSLSVYVLLFLKYTALAIIPVLLFRICKNISSGNQPFWIIPIYSSLIFYSYFTLFLINHDIWFIMLLITLLFYKYHGHIKESNLHGLGIGWGVLGGIIFLSSPTLGLVFVFLTLLPYTQTSLKKKVTLVVLSLIICSPWVARNYLVFNKLILMKSNLFFDMYQSSYLDDDGVLDQETLANFHPFENEEARAYYTSLGENDFMEKYRHDFFVKLQDQPITFITKTGNRFLKMFLLYPIFSPLAKPHGVVANIVYFIKAVIYCIPFLIALFFILSNKRIDHKTIYTALIIFFVYLSPYIFVGFYRRYRIPLVPIFSILYFYFIIYSYTYLTNPTTFNSIKKISN